MGMVRGFCKTAVKSKQYLVTTPLYYVNAEPHLGHVYSSVLADVASRWRTIQHNEKVILLSGTDEHGTKVERAATSVQEDVQKYCSRVSSTFRAANDLMQVRCDKWVRTEEINHKKTVQWLWRRLLDRRHLVEGGEYRGWYCVADEAFVREDELVHNDTGELVTIDGGRSVEWTEERNWVFRAGTDVLKAVNKWLQGRITPPDMQRLAERLLQEYEESGGETSISRPIGRVPWGISVPDDPAHTVYVWLDALCGYLTGAGAPDEEVLKERWPPDLQVLGKDIVRFHCVLWPCVLLAAGLQLPRKLHIHAHWTDSSRRKMSKSLGNVARPNEEADALTPDAFRYFLLREAVPHSDGTYSRDRARRMVNAELADTLGNLVSRCSGRTINKKSMRFWMPRDITVLTSPESELCQVLERLPHVCSEYYGRLDTRDVVESVLHAARLANQCVEAARPWELNGPNDTERLQDILGLALHTARCCYLLLQPLIPSLSERALDLLGVPKNRRFWEYACMHPWTHPDHEQDIPLNFSQGHVLFKRILAPINPPLKPKTPSLAR